MASLVRPGDTPGTANQRLQPSAEGTRSRGSSYPEALRDSNGKVPRRFRNASPTRLPSASPDVRFWPAWTNLRFEELGFSLAGQGPSAKGGV